MPKRAKADASFIGPLAERLAFALKLQMNISRVVEVLLATFDPARVLRRVGAVIIAAINSQSGQRFGIVVSNEQADIVPTVAHGDAASTVAVKRSGCRAIATVHHAGPDTKQTVLGHAVLGPCRGQFGGKASAGLASSASQSDAIHCALSAAIAHAVIERVTTCGASVAAKNKPATKALTANVFGKATYGHRAKTSTTCTRFPLSSPLYAEGIA